MEHLRHRYGVDGGFRGSNNVMEPRLKLDFLGVQTLLTTNSVVRGWEARIAENSFDASKSRDNRSLCRFSCLHGWMLEANSYKSATYDGLGCFAGSCL